MEISDAIQIISGLKEHYDGYSAAFKIAIQQLQGTLDTKLQELDDTKVQLAAASEAIAVLQTQDQADEPQAPDPVNP